MATHPEIAIDDEEIAALLEELEAEQQKFEAAPAGPTIEEPIVKPKQAGPIIDEPVTKPKPVEAVKQAIEKLKESQAETARQAEDLEQEIEEVKAAEPVEAVEQRRVRAEEQTDKFEPEPVVEAPAPKMNFYVDVNQFNRDTKLTEATLDAAMMEQAGLRAYYGSQAAQAEAQHSRLKVRFDVLEAKLYDEHRKALAVGGEKVTEKMVENAVKLDARWAKAKNAVIEAETIAAINKSLVISLADRRDMMIQLGADRREEFKGGVRILAEQNERDSLAARARDAYKNGRGVQ